MEKRDMDDAGPSKTPKLIFDLEDKREVKTRNSSKSLILKQEMIPERFNKFILELEDLFKAPGDTDPNVLVKLEKYRKEKFEDIFNNDLDFNDYSMSERLWIYKYWFRNSMNQRVSINLYVIGYTV